MSPPSRFGMVAARMALEDAGLEQDALSSGHGEESTAVVFGTSYGPSSYSERILRQIILESPQAASPMLFTESVANAPASQVALALDCKGPNVTVTQREASALLAVAEGAALIRSGKVRRALVGGVEELNPLLHAILDRFGALAGRGYGNDSCVEADAFARPLDNRRNGFVGAEGSAVLVLERVDDALSRNANIRAQVGPAARAFDPLAPATGWSHSSVATARRLGREWHRLNGGGADVDKLGESRLSLVLGSNGGRDHDRFEASLINELAEARSSSIAVPKLAFGEQGMATLVGGLLLLEGIRPTGPSDFEIDPSIARAPSGRAGWTHNGLQKLLLSSVSAGGACCWLGLESA